MTSKRRRSYVTAGYESYIAPRDEAIRYLSAFYRATPGTLTAVNQDAVLNVAEFLAEVFEIEPEDIEQAAS